MATGDYVRENNRFGPLASVERDWIETSKKRKGWTSRMGMDLGQTGRNADRLSSSQHHHRTNIDKYHPGYFGKVGMRRFHLLRNHQWNPVINLDKVCSETTPMSTINPFLKTLDEKNEKNTH